LRKLPQKYSDSWQSWFPDQQTQPDPACTYSIGCTPTWMIWICWLTAESTSSSKRLNSSKHPHAPHFTRPTKIRPMARKSNSSSQLNTSTWAFVCTREIHSMCHTSALQLKTYVVTSNGFPQHDIHKEHMTRYTSHFVRA